MEYPLRSGSFDRTVHRALRQSCAAKDIGRDACLLVQFVVDVEDELFYSRAPDFWTSQLDEMLGFRSKKQLIEARDRAVAAGWLHYEPGGTRRPGRYFAMIPGEAVIESAPDDSQVSDQAAPISSADGTNQAGISSAGNPNQKPISSARNTNPATISSARGTNATRKPLISSAENPNQDSISSATNTNQATISSADGTNTHHKPLISSAGNTNQEPISSKNEAISSAGGTPPYPFSNPNTIATVFFKNEITTAITKQEAQPSKAHPPIEAIDLELAQQFFSDLRKLDGSRAEPDFDSWAREFEQLRKGEAPEEPCGPIVDRIREAMAFVADHHEFWRTRIRKPKSLRKNWGEISFQCAAAKKALAAKYPPPIPDLTDDESPKEIKKNLMMSGTTYYPNAHLYDPNHGTF